MKKWIGLLLAVWMILGLFAGCGDQFNTEATNPTEVIENFAQVDWDVLPE